MTIDYVQIGLDAVDEFLTTWNSRDPVLWASSLNYPHVRPSPNGPVAVIANAEDYAANMNYQKVIDSGWHHSEWDYKHVLHTSPTKIHVAGQWSRFSEQGNLILTTPIVYVVTRRDNHWGIQSRFSADYVDDDTDTTGFATRGINLIADFVNQYETGNSAACAELLNYPHFNVTAGKLDILSSAEEFSMKGGTMAIESMQAIQTGLHSMNAAVTLRLATDTLDQQLECVIHVNNRNDHLGIQGWSLLNPDEPVEDRI